MLEDNSGRVRIKKNEVFIPEKFVTGSIIALKGIVDVKGFFEVKDFCYAGIPFQSVPRGVNTNLKRGLYEGLENREFVAFVSGLEFGEPGDVVSSELILRFFRGELMSSSQSVKLASSISRVIICGNSIVQPEETDQVLRGSYLTQTMNQQ